MTKKHFRKIADTLRTSKSRFKSDRQYAEFCIAMGYVCAEFNKSFSMSKFLDACHTGKPSIIQPKDLI